MELSENEIRITKNAMDKFLERKIQTNLNLQFELDLVSPYCNYLREQRQDLKIRTAKKYGTLFFFLTINPDEKKTTFEKFRDKALAFCQRSMISTYYLTFEQRGKTPETCGEGFHLHILASRNIQYGMKKVIENGKNSFKNITNIKDFHLFNYHWTKEEFFQDKLDYITGQKIGKDEEEKQLKQKMDVVFREKNNIDLYYTNAPAQKKALQKENVQKEITTNEPLQFDVSPTNSSNNST